jgi:DNA-binding XRE family transcriptional regulator
MARPRIRRGPRGSFADRLRAARAASGLSQEGAAEAIGVHRVTIASWETGERRPVGVVARVVEAWIKSAKGGSRAE